jgi:hypothetical protein
MKIFDYHYSDKNQIRRTYLQKRPYQSIDRAFSKIQCRKMCRHFNPAWFTKYAN